MHALTIDVEDYFQVTAFEDCVAREAWDAQPSRVERNTRHLLELFARVGTRGTFFVLGWIAERFPQLVNEIADAGHEIASHGYWHQRVYQQSPVEFRADVRRSRELLEQLTGRPITMYRAPTFSITRQTLWALDILIEEGYTLDASIFPIHHDRYGIPDSPPHLHRRTTASGVIWEFPPTVARIAGRNLPIGGGGYFRLLPCGITRALWRHCERATSAPLMFYLHPWEIDPDQPRVVGASRMNAWRHRVNLRTTAAKLERLLQEFRFGTITEVLTRHTSQDQSLALAT